jgi:hypothetical protein
MESTMHTLSVTAANHGTSPSHAAPTSPASPAQPSRRAWGLGLLLIADALLSFAPLAIMAPAIGWPASLGNPAAQQLQAIAAAPGAVMAGYGLYLLYSILVAPVMIGLAARLTGGLASPLGATVAAFAALSALARSIGILRWLTVMPALAAAHAAADPASRTQIELVFTAVTQYGGGIGEILGVSLFMAAALGTLCVGAWLRGGLPIWLAGLGLLSALLLAGLALPVFGGPKLVPVAAAVSLLSVWMLAAGVHVLTSRR